jgi:hypothetical protein
VGGQRDTAWAATLSSQTKAANRSSMASDATGSGSSASVVLPPTPTFRPDTIISLNDTVAIWDWTYTRRPNTFTLVGPNGRQYLLQAENEEDMNSWIAAINWAASFKSTGIRMRPAASSSSDSRSHSRSWSRQFQRTPKTSTSSGSSRGSAEKPFSLFSSSTRSRTTVLRSGDSDGDTYGRKSVVDKSWEDDYVFEPSSSTARNSIEPPRGFSEDNRHRDLHRIPRSDMVRAKISELDVQIEEEKATLQADLRIARNLAVLTPFLSSTRQRVQQAVEPVARRVKNTRRLLCKSLLWREVLLRDLLAEDRDVIHIKASPPPSRQEQHPDGRAGGLEDGESETRPLAYRSRNEASRSEAELHVLRPSGDAASRAALRGHRSNTGDRLVPPHAAHSFASSSELEEEVEEEDFLDPVPIVAEPRPRARSDRGKDEGGVDRTSSVPSIGPSRSLASTSTSHTMSAEGNDESTVPSELEETPGSVEKEAREEKEDEEKAEDWNRTRAAKRVSLVNLPDSAAMLVRYKADVLFPPPSSESPPSNATSVQESRRPRLDTTLEEEDRRPDVDAAAGL